MVAMSLEVEQVLKQVKSWPVETRIVLARRLLETLDGGERSTPGELKGPPSQQVLGLWNPGGAAPTDEECAQILAEELRRKHAS